MDKLPVAAYILIGTFIVAILAGFNAAFGKFLFVFMVVVAVAWFIGTAPQSDVSKWSSVLTGKSSGGVQVV